MFSKSNQQQGVKLTRSIDAAKGSTLCHTVKTFKDPKGEERFEKNIVGKEENAGNHHFILFLQCSQPHQRQEFQTLLCRLHLL